MELSILEITFVVIAIELELSGSSFLSVFEATGELDGVFVPALDSLAVVKIIFPLTLVHGSIISYEDAKSVCSTILILSLINIAICVCHSSLAMEEAVFGLATIN